LRDYLLLGMMPYFPVAEYDVTQFDQEQIFAEYIQSERNFGKFQLRPLGIKYEDTKSIAEGWAMSSPEKGMVLVSARQAVYQLTIIDDNVNVESFIDCLLGFQALMYQFATDDYVLMPIPAELIPASRIIPIQRAVDIYCGNLKIPTYYPEQTSLFATKSTGGSEWDALLWDATAAVIGDEQVTYALLFLRAAIEHIMFVGDDFERAIHEQEAKARRIKEAVDIENSIHNCYKVIEAIYGGMLATDWRKVEDRFQEFGIDLQKVGGFQTWWGNFAEESYLDKLKKLQAARNDRAAHGRIHANRRSTYFELMDYQILATTILRNYIENKYTYIRL
jgi:hypothetical protein